MTIEYVPPTREELRAKYDKFTEQGFLVIPRLAQYDAGYLRSLISMVFSLPYNGSRDLDLAARDLFENHFDTFLGCCHAAQRLPALYRFFCTSIPIQLQELGLKFPNINTQPLLHFSSRHVAKNEHHWRVGAHQDWPSNQGSLNGVTVWVPLMSVTTELGALQVIPGSHKRGALRHHNGGVPLLDFPPQDGWIDLPMQEGDVLIMSSFLIHRSGENVTDRIRLSAACRFNDLTEPSYIERGFPNPPPLAQRHLGSLWPDADELKVALERHPYHVD